jgi:RNA polymerase sigma-70 factor, ECF subfamily
MSAESIANVVESVSAVSREGNSREYTVTIDRVTSQALVGKESEVGQLDRSNSSHDFYPYKSVQHDEESDADLVTKTLEGDSSAFERIVQRYRGAISRRCSRILGSREAARDATQETFTRALQNLDTLQQKNKLAGWLTVIAINYCWSVITAEKPYLQLSTAGESIFPSRAPDPEQQLIASEQRVIVEGLLDRLKPRQKLVVVMRYIDGHSYSEIMRLTGLSYKQVKSYLQNAVRKLGKATKTNSIHRLSCSKVPS